jgi:hypothetical protein
VVLRFFDRHGVSFKRSVRGEQDRPDVVAPRTSWVDNQPQLDPKRLVFIDETGTSANMAQLRSRVRAASRWSARIPHSRWKITTFVAGLGANALTRGVKSQRASGNNSPKAIASRVQFLLLLLFRTPEGVNENHVTEMWGYAEELKVVRAA